MVYKSCFQELGGKLERISIVTRDTACDHLQCPQHSPP
jgi:hypothetical protein